MKIALNLSLFFIVFFALGEGSYSLSNYQIKNICKNEKRISSCIKDLQDKKSKLEKGNQIEIPVIPFKK
jgi:hypothetical protein